jgi:S-adenosylmethionine uptake transporter
LQAFFWSALSYLISAFNDLLTKVSGINLPPQEVIFFRFLFSTIILLPFFLNQKRLSINKTRNERHTIHLLRAVLWMVGIYLWTYNASRIPLHIVTISSFLIPFFNIFLSRVYLKERVSSRGFFYMTISFFGVLSVFHMSSFSAVNFIFIILATLTFSSLDVLNKKIVSENNSIINMIFFSNLYSLLMCAPFIFVDYVVPSSNELMFLFLLGIGASSIIFCILKSFESSNLSSIQYVRYLEFPISCILGFTFFDEIPSALVIAGCIVVILGNIMSYRLNTSKT